MIKYVVIHFMKTNQPKLARLTVCCLQEITSIEGIISGHLIIFFNSQMGH